jgi:hypothetical protein
MGTPVASLYSTIAYGIYENAKILKAFTNNLI